MSKHDKEDTQKENKWKDIKLLNDVTDTKMVIEVLELLMNKKNANIC